MAHKKNFLISLLLSAITCLECGNLDTGFVDVSTLDDIPTRRASVLSGASRASDLGETAISTKVPLRGDKEIDTLFECGKVPIYEKLYQKSINMSEVKVDENGDFRILHGLDAVAGEWPWIVKIKECKEDEECGHCTGTLLNSRWVITAGHCGFNRSSVEKYTAIFGLYDLLTPDNESFTMKFDKKVVHPEYQDMNNDLTLFRLDRAIKFNDYIQPACLIGSTKNVIAYAQRKKCFTVGYGLVEDMVEAIKLQKLQILAKQPSDCNSDKLNNLQLRRGTVCIGPLDGKIGGSCKGDSGGPDLCYDPKENHWTIFGTVSFGPAICDREDGDKWLTVSVDLSDYRTWILSVISDES